MNLNELLHASVQKLVDSGKIEEMIEKQVEKTLGDALSELLGRYNSDFRKSLDETLKQSFALNGSLDLPGYNDLILKIVRRQVEAYTNNTIQRQIMDNLTQLLEPAPAEISLEDLVQKYREFLRDKENGGCVCFDEADEIYFTVKDSDYGDFRHVELGPEKVKPGEKAYLHDHINIGLHKGEVYSLRIANHDLEKNLFVGPFYSFERFVFQMKVNKTKVTNLDNWEFIDTYKLHEQHA